MFCGATVAGCGLRVAGCGLRVVGEKARAAKSSVILSGVQRHRRTSTSNNAVKGFKLPLLITRTAMCGECLSAAIRLAHRSWTAFWATTPVRGLSTRATKARCWLIAAHAQSISPEAHPQGSPQPGRFAAERGPPFPDHDLLGGGIRGVAGQGRVRSTLAVGHLLHPAPGVEAQQLHGWMDFRFQQTGPEPHLAPRRRTRPRISRFDVWAFSFHSTRPSRLTELGPRRLADPQEKRLSVAGGRIGQRA